jgi:acyl-CoA thioesterase
LSKGRSKAAKKPTGKLPKADLARVVERLRHSNPVNHFGFQLAKAERGRAVFRMPVREIHKQVHRVVHGGVVATLADTAGGFASFLAAPPGSRVATIEMKINFMEAVADGEIKADARVLRIGRTTSVVDCDVTDQDGRLVAKALMTFSVRRPGEARKAN